MFRSCQRMFIRILFLFLLLSFALFSGVACSDQPDMPSDLSDILFIDGDYELYYVSVADGLTNPGSLVLVDIADSVPAPKQSGYIIAHYSGSAAELILPQYASDGTPIIGIGRWAFCHAPNLKNVTIPTGYQYIFRNAFLGVSTLESIYIGSTVEYISSPGVMFEQCNNLTVMNVDPANPHFMSDGNCMLTKDGLTLLSGCSGTVIPEGTQIIANCAFSERKGPDVIRFPSSVTEIQEAAFMRCDTEAVYIDKHVTVVREHAFSGCGQTTVYCYMESKPSTWHEEWYAVDHERLPSPTVIWGVATE